MGSKNRTTQKTTTVSNQVGQELSDSAIGVAGDNNTIVTTDSGIAKGAFDVVDNTVDRGFDFGDNALAFANDNNQQTAGLISQIFGGSIKAVKDSNNQALDFVEDSTRTAEQNLSNKLVSYTPLAIGALVVVILFSARGKK